MTQSVTGLRVVMSPWLSESSLEPWGHLRQRGSQPGAAWGGLGLTGLGHNALLLGSQNTWSLSFSLPAIGLEVGEGGREGERA